MSETHDANPDGKASQTGNGEDEDPMVLLEQTRREEEKLKQKMLEDGPNDAPGGAENSAGASLGDETETGEDNSSTNDELNGDELDTDYATNNEWKPLLEYRREAIRIRNKQQNMQLRDRIAGVAIALVCIQVFVANVYFLIYLLTNLNSTSPNVMIAWLSASVVEVIGLMLVVARSLFKPDRKGRDNSN